jgi:hypothetical protein
VRGGQLIDHLEKSTSFAQCAPTIDIENEMIGKTGDLAVYLSYLAVKEFSVMAAHGLCYVYVCAGLCYEMVL